MTTFSESPKFQAELAREQWRGSARRYPFRADVALHVPEELYAAIGLLSKQWSDIEFLCRSVLSATLNIEFEKILLLTSGMQARTLLDTTRRTIHYVLPEYAIRYDVTQERLQRAHEYRNQIVHSNHTGDFLGILPARSIEWKVRLNRKGISFSRQWTLAAHHVRRRALMSRLLGLKLMDVEADVQKLLKQRAQSPAPSA